MNKCLCVLFAASALAWNIGRAAWAQSTLTNNPRRSAMIAQAGLAADNLTLLASTDQAVTRGGDAITLKIAGHNPTESWQSHAVVGSSSVFELFDFAVLYDADAPADFTAFGKPRLIRRLSTVMDPSPVTSLLVAPGQSRDYQVVLSRLFDMSRAGTYQITVRWHDPFKDVVGQRNRKQPSANVSSRVIVRVDDPTPDFYGDSNIITR